MPAELLTMSQKEIDRASTIEKLESAQLPQSLAATLLGLSTRQVRNLQ